MIDTFQTNEAARILPQLGNVTAQSCLDYLKRGVKTDGYNSIKNYGTDGWVHTVYCDFQSEPGFAWTLVESFALKNKLLPAFRIHPLKVSAPVNPYSPNWNLFRMSFLQMSRLRAQSTHWRVTCSFQTNSVDIYRDYARTSFKKFDVLDYVGVNVCKKMEYINIRGQQCTECTVGWIATLNKFATHIDGPASTTCQFKPGKDAVYTEDNFGLYWASNKKFRCTTSPDATTNYWFGGYY